MLKLTAKLSKGCLAALLALALGAGEALADVAVDAANFPDGNFRQWVKENAAKGGDVLTDAQIASVEEMDLSYGEMASLKGLERFTALKALTCLSNSLKTLDLPAGGLGAWRRARARARPVPSCPSAGSRSSRQASLAAEGARPWASRHRGQARRGHPPLPRWQHRSFWQRRYGALGSC